MLESFATFFVAAALLAATPGPDLLFTMAQSALQGARAGMVFVSGLCSGLLVHSMAVAGGVAAAVAAVPNALRAVQLAGCVYLAWLAVQLWRAPALAASCAEASEAENASAALQPGRLYRRGVWMNLTNPKVLLCFLALLPQFVVPEGPPASLQMLALGGLFIVATVVVFGSAALLAGRAQSTVARSVRTQLTIYRASAAMLTLVALRMLSVGLEPVAPLGSGNPTRAVPHEPAESRALPAGTRPRARSGSAGVSP